MSVSKKLNPSLNAALHKVGKKYVEAVKLQLVKEDNHASGALNNTMKYKIVDNSIDLMIARYGDVIDSGSSPAASPLKPSREYVQNIMEWAMAKRLTPRSGSMRKMAYAIARKIKRDGQMGTQVFDRVYQRLESEFGKEITEAYEKDITNQLNNLD